ncbi:hypothetical protein [Caulobacter sp.]|uniref:hypothetical protein n=1 Tax=Caulobacter sp. TaxID=78 RepID=UPI001B25369D|nr:hypothetical protein [Caulobacter sp.]MBO9546988.1 hypothetical protein [Caulobacter sp.]
MSSYTFICLTDNQVATFVDPQPIDAEAIRSHAFNLLREHASTAVVEVWQDEKLVEKIARDGVRAWPRGDASGDAPEITP